MKMRNQKNSFAIFTVLGFLAFTGCAPALVAISREDLAQLKNQAEIGAVRHEPAAFYGDVGFYGLIGWGMSLSAGKEIRTKYGIEDPARAIEEQFLQNLRPEFKGMAVRVVDQPVSDDDLAAAKSAYAGRWVFDFKTIGWGSAIEGDVEYTVRARLIRNEDFKVLWQGACKHETKDNKWEPLTANNAALLKKKLEAGVSPCARDLWAQFQAGR
jgi:hypothetical protein